LLFHIVNTKPAVSFAVPFLLLSATSVHRLVQRCSTGPFDSLQSGILATLHPTHRFGLLPMIVRPAIITSCLLWSTSWPEVFQGVCCVRNFPFAGKLLDLSTLATIRRRRRSIDSDT
jgi:hypothetical protein